MPSHPPQWTDFLQCSSCEKEFSLEAVLHPISLPCSHTVCQRCISAVYKAGCRYDPNCMPCDPQERKIKYPVNTALLKIVAHQADEPETSYQGFAKNEIGFLGRNDYALYQNCVGLIETISSYLQDIQDGILPQNLVLTKPMLRKIVGLVQCQIAVSEGRIRALRACRAIGERAATELILAHQNPAKLSGNLWTAVRARGCQFLGPAMQEEALRLILLSLEDGSELSRKVLVMFVVQRLQTQFPQASKTSIGHVVQLLYRASCFVVKKRDGDSSLMKLKEEYRTYSTLRREHDTQVVQIAREAGLRIAPDQWSALLYGDQGHKSHMQSIIDRLQSSETLTRCIQDLTIAFEKSNNLALKSILPNFAVLAKISEPPLYKGEYDDEIEERNDWDKLCECLRSVHVILQYRELCGLHFLTLPETYQELVAFSSDHAHEIWRDEEADGQSMKFKTSFCRDIKNKGRCPRGVSCTFAHTEEELHRHRNKRKKASLSAAASHSLSQQKAKAVSKEESARNQGNDARPATVEEDDRPPQHHANQTPQIQHAYRETPPYQLPPITPPYVPSKPAPDHPNPQHQALRHPPMHYPPPSQPYPCNYPGPAQPQIRPENAHPVSQPGQQRNFTVTLSFQAAPDQQSMQLAGADIMHSPRFHDAIHQQQARTNLENFEHELNAPLRAPPPVYHPYQQSPNHFYQMNHPDLTVMTPPMHPPPPIYPAGSQIHTPSMSQPFARLQGACYDPNYQQQAYSPAPMSHGNAVAYMTHQNHPMFVPVRPVVPGQAYEPQPQYYAPDPSSLVHSGSIFCVNERDSRVSTRSPSVRPLGISKSVEHASVDDLIRRKIEILKQMMHNQKADEPVTSESKDRKYYDVWSCRSYSPLLNVGHASALEKSGDSNFHDTVNVTSELDTGTRQVTVRGGDHINPSPARNEHILDDDKMHQILVEKNVEQFIQAVTSSVTSSTHSTKTYPERYFDDEVIPFSDRPTVSKYGPIARSVKTMPIATECVQVSSNTSVSTQSVHSITRSVKPLESYSSFDMHDAITCFPASPLNSQISCNLNDPEILSQCSGISLSQAATNSQLLGREQAALQQCNAPETNLDLELVAELQQIELGLQQKNKYSG